MSKRNAGKPQTPVADELDRRILALYQHDTRLTGEYIGARVGLSAAAVQRRLKRLRKSGVIEAEVARLNAEVLGLPVTCVVGVDLEQERSPQIDAFKQRMRQHPQVEQCFYVTGEFEFVLVVTTPSLADYECFTREMLMNTPCVRAFTTLVSMDRVKRGPSLALEAIP
ncbi:Lrp/AsnC family transcriptional regulator [Kushneria aurantia]|nr:Lrp/AsnC family transcriptional regulator [Kushneria aurantia]